MKLFLLGSLTGIVATLLILYVLLATNIGKPALVCHTFAGEEVCYED